MTALKEYVRLESTGLWRPASDAQRRDVYVFVGQATLVIADKAEAPLAHWSLAAVERLNPGSTPALFAPGLEADESLEMSDPDMIEAIERVQKAVRKAAPHPGRVRLVMALGLACLIVALGALWLPRAVADHAAEVLPPAQEARLGKALFDELQRLTGPACGGPEHRAVLDRLANRVLGPDAPVLYVMRDGITNTLVLPGGAILISRALVEDYETSAPAAGYILAAHTRAAQTPPFETLLDTAGLVALLRLLTTGEMPEAALRHHAQELARQDIPPETDPALAEAFARARIPVLPYAYALDITGDETAALIAADPFAGTAAPVVLDDNSWVILQGICAS